MLRDVIFHGIAAKKFGRKFTLQVKSPAEAVRALCVQIKGLERFIKEHNWQVIFKGKRTRGLDEPGLLMYQGAGEFHFVPIISGRGGKKGLIKIILGVALIAFAFIAAPAAGLSAAFMGSVTYGQIAGIGIAMLLTGVSQLLAPKPKHEDPDKKDTSFIFGGQANVVSQGGSVPVGFGRFTVGSVVISAGINTDQIAIGVNPVFTTI